jgi:DNA-binding NarL/FixJ family response regulator
MSDSGQRPEKVRVLVLDEQPLLRYGLCAYLDSQPDMTVCGEAGSILEAESKIAECNPQLLVTALRLGVGDTFEFIKALKAENQDLRVLVYPAFEESIFAQRAIRAGANGYVMKKALREELPAAIRDIMKGEIYVSREVALSEFKKSLPEPPKHDDRLGSASAPENLSHDDRLGSATALENLSDREIQIFRFLGSGLGTRQIAELLSLSVKTVDSHCENIKHKLQISSSAELRRRAAKLVEQGFLEKAVSARRPMAKKETAVAGLAG